MAIENKKRHLVSYEKMSKEVAEAFNAKYPKGFSDYFDDLTKYPKPDGTFFYAVTIEVPDGIYMVKLNAKVDNPEDLEKWWESEKEAETEEVAGAAQSADAGDNALPDDNISQYSSDDDSSETV